MLYGFPCFLTETHEISLSSTCIIISRKKLKCNFQINTLPLQQCSPCIQYALCGHFGACPILFCPRELSCLTPTQNRICQVSGKATKLSPLSIFLPHAALPSVLRPLQNKLVVCLLCCNRSGSLLIKMM